MTKINHLDYNEETVIWSTARNKKKSIYKIWKYKSELCGRGKCNINIFLGFGFFIERGFYLTIGLVWETMPQGKLKFDTFVARTY